MSGQTVWRRDVRDVAVPLGFGAVPLGSAKHAGINAACGMICGIKSVPKECPARASYKVTHKSASHVSFNKICTTPHVWNDFDPF